ncbi:hypothetical protein NQ656_17480 [Acinetobacter baumannii]|nr:hypothetical protein [Acinetobacter baumannii]
MENLYFFTERNKYLRDIKYLIFSLIHCTLEDFTQEHQELISMSVKILNNGVLYKMDFSSLISFRNELIKLAKELQNGNE